MRVVPYLLCLTTAGCFTGGGLEPEAPEFAPGEKCRVTKSKARPLIVEWSSPDRADLEARIQGGVVVVRYDGCDLEVLTGCIVEGAGYDYTAVTKKFDRVSITNEDELYASLPVGAASLSARLATSGRLTVDMIMVGAYRADVVGVDVGQLRGACSQATHFVAGLTAGAFEFYTGAGAEVGADASGFGLRGGGKSSSEQESLSRDGKPEKCASAPGTPAPPRGCGALLRLQVTPITGGAGPDEPAVAPPLPNGAGSPEAPDAPAAGPSAPADGASAARQIIEAVAVGNYGQLERTALLTREVHDAFQTRRRGELTPAELERRWQGYQKKIASKYKEIRAGGVTIDSIGEVTVDEDKGGPLHIVDVHVARREGPRTTVALYLLEEEGRFYLVKWYLRN